MSTTHGNSHTPSTPSTYPKTPVLTPEDPCIHLRRLAYPIHAHRPRCISRRPDPTSLSRHLPTLSRTRAFHLRFVYACNRCKALVRTTVPLCTTTYPWVTLQGPSASTHPCLRPVCLDMHCCIFTYIIYLNTYVRVCACICIHLYAPTQTPAQAILSS